MTKWDETPMGCFIVYPQLWTVSEPRKCPNSVPSFSSKQSTGKQLLSNSEVDSMYPKRTSFSAWGWIPYVTKNTEEELPWKYPPLCFQTLLPSCYSIWIIYIPIVWIRLNLTSPPASTHLSASLYNKQLESIVYTSAVQYKYNEPHL